MGIHFAVVNLVPELVPYNAAAAMVEATGVQLALHLGPVWALRDLEVALYDHEDDIPNSAFPVRLLDNAAEYGAMGALADHGVNLGRVFVADVLAMGGNLLDGPQCVAAALSHELVEAAVDLTVDRWEQMPDGDFVALEVADPVEGYGYDVEIGSGKTVTVSDFASPSWFRQSANDIARDWMGMITKSFAVGAAPGCYCVVERADGTTETWPRHALLSPWKASPGARTIRRLKGRQAA